MDEIWLLAGWLDEQHSTMDWDCECGPPIVLILKIPLGQAFFSVPAIHTFIVLQWTISLAQRTPRVTSAALWCATFCFLGLYTTTAQSTVESSALVVIVFFPPHLFTNLSHVVVSNVNPWCNAVGTCGLCCEARKWHWWWLEVEMFLFFF